MPLGGLLSAVALHISVGNFAPRDNWVAILIIRLRYKMDRCAL